MYDGRELYQNFEIAIAADVAAVRGTRKVQVVTFLESV
jgi:hypothetical protein